MFILKIAKVVGTPNGQAWSQIHDFKVDEEKLGKRGRLLVILTLTKAGEGVEAVGAGREVLARLNEEYYGNLKGSPFERLGATLKKLEREFKNLELVVAVFYQKAGYFGILRGGKVVIKRGSVIQKVLSLGSDGQPGNAKTQNDIKTQKILITSGYIEKGDVLLLGSKKFFEEVAEGTWRAALGSGEPEEMVEILAPIVAGREKAGGVAAGVVKVGREIETEVKGSPVGETITEITGVETQSVSVPSGVKLGLGDAPSELPQESQRIPKRFSSVPSVIRRISKKIIPSPSVFVRRQVEQQRQKKTLLTVASILIFLLLVSVVLGTRKRELDRKTAKFEEIVSGVESRLEEGKGLGAIKPSEARQSLEEARKLLGQAEEFQPKVGWPLAKKAVNLELKALKDEIEAELAKAMREFKLDDVIVFFDLSLVNEGARGDDLALLGNSLIVLDKEDRRVVSIGIANKSAKILAGGEDLAGASQVTAYDEEIYTLVNNGILETKAGKTNLVSEKSDRWQKIIDLKTFLSNLYLLDSQADTVWRHLIVEEGFGGAQSWFKGASMDLSKATSLAIDGSLWITRKDKQAPILKFTSGLRQDFAIGGLDKPLISPTRIFTDDTTDNLYILDKGNWRVVVLDKDGSYQASYLWIGMADVEDMVVSEAQKKIFLLAGSKIYEIQMR